MIRPSIADQLFSGACQEVFGTFKTDIHGKRIVKFESMVKTIQKLSPNWLMDQSFHKLEINEQGIHIELRREFDKIRVTAGNESFLVDEHNVYTNGGVPTTPVMLSPRLIREILAA